MRARTEAEIKAYIDGYNACYKQFCECLKVRPLWKAIKKMDLFVTAVNGCVEDEPQYILREPTDEERQAIIECAKDEPQTDCSWK